MNEEHKQLLNFTPSLILDEIKKEHWVMGANSEIKGEPLVPNADWTPYCPAGEVQKNTFFDSYNCTGFGFTNRAEMIFKRLGVERNFSDRGLGIVAGTRPPGNSPFTVAEAARKNGLLDEEDLPFDEFINNVTDYFSPSPLTSSLAKKALAFLSFREPQHDWVSTDLSSLKYALQFSPLLITVTAWYRNEKGLYYCPPGVQNQHDTTLIKINPDGTKVVFDSYQDENGSYFKTLTADHPHQLAMRYWLGPGVEAKRNIILQIIAKLWELFKITPPDPVIVADEPILPPVEPTPKPMPTIQQLAKEIEKYENAPKFLNNPGALRYSVYQTGTYRQKSTGSLLSTFTSYELGWKALIHQLTIVCRGTSPAYNAVAVQKLLLTNCGEMTISDFFHVYAPSSENKPDLYAGTVAKNLGVPLEFQMKKFT